MQANHILPTMIFTASYFCPRDHHGQKISISLSEPARFKGLEKIPFFSPSWDLVTRWQKSKQTPHDWDTYREDFNRLINSRWGEISGWLEERSYLEDITLLCWEQPGTYCHRNEIGKLIAKNLPHLWGGKDKEQSRIERLIIECRRKGIDVSCFEQKFPEENISFYEVFLKGTSLGGYTETGVLGLLSQMRNPIYPRTWFEDRRIVGVGR